MTDSKQSSDINRGKVERAYASILDFSVGEIELLMNKLRARKAQLNSDKKSNTDTIGL